MGKRDRHILENVVIENVAAEGNALAHYEGKALFVPVCIPGDVVDVQITHKRSSYMMGYVIRIVKPSPLRVTVLQSFWRLRRLQMAASPL